METNNNEVKNENVIDEQKSDLADERKSSLASRGFGAIIFMGVALGLIYFLLSSSGNKSIDVKPKNDKFEVSIEKKTFTPPPPPPVVEPVKQNFTEDLDFILKKQVNEQPPKPTIVKSLSGAVVTGNNGKVQEAQTGGNTYGNVIKDNEQYIKDLKEGADSYQKEIMSILSNNANNNEKEDYATAALDAASKSTVVTAKKSTIDPNLSLDKGTFIPCVLKTQIISTIAGNVACIVTNDVYSSAGTVLLIEKGSTVQGSFKSASMQIGMERLFVIWEEIKTPKRVVIDISSGATDELGGSGMEGWVDNHWIKRFGSAIMLSMIDDALSFALGRGRENLNEDSAYLYTQNTRDTAVSMADTVLKSTINIPPTLYKNHGDVVGIYVNKDIDFSRVYKLTRSNK